MAKFKFWWSRGDGCGKVHLGTREYSAMCGARPWSWKGAPQVWGPAARCICSRCITIGAQEHKQGALPDDFDVRMQQVRRTQG